MFGDENDVKLGAFCSSEPDAGSDVSAIRTKAVYDEAKDEWVINGTKTWATNGGIADVHVVVCTVDPELKARGHASFVIPPNTPGLSQGQKFQKHGIRASHTAEVVPRRRAHPRLLPARRQGEARRAKLARAREGTRSGKGNASMATFEASRPSVGAQAVGIARAAYDYALEYAKTRVQFGKPIVENQAVAFMLADMKTQVDASRLLVHRAAWMARNSKPFTSAEGSMSKLHAGETAVKRHRAGHPDPRRQRLHPRVPGRADGPRREDLHDLRGHQRDPAARHRPHHLGCVHPLGRPAADSAVSPGSGGSGDTAVLCPRQVLVPGRLAAWLV